MTAAQKARNKIKRAIASLPVPKRYSINTESISDADKTRRIQKGTL